MFCLDVWSTASPFFIVRGGIICEVKVSKWRCQNKIILWNFGNLAKKIVGCLIK